MSTCWQSTQAYRQVSGFNSLETVFSVPREIVTGAPLRQVNKVENNGTSYFVKRYTAGGKSLRHYTDYDKFRAGWGNLLYFQRPGLPIAPVAACGEDTHCGIRQKGLPGNQ